MKPIYNHTGPDKLVSITERKYYLDVKEDCKTCEGGGMSIWSGNDCPKCLKIKERK